MMFIAGAVCCCLVLVSCSFFFGMKELQQGMAAYAEIDDIANRAYGKPYDLVINQMKSKYISTGLNTYGNPDAVLVYKVGNASVGVPNRKDIYVGLGIDDNNVVREVRWYKDGDGWPSTVKAKSVVTVTFL